MMGHDPFSKLKEEDVLKNIFVEGEKEISSLRVCVIRQGPGGMEDMVGSGAIGFTQISDASHRLHFIMSEESGKFYITEDFSASQVSSKAVTNVGEGTDAAESTTTSRSAMKASVENFYRSEHTAAGKYAVMRIEDGGLHHLHAAWDDTAIVASRLTAEKQQEHHQEKTEVFAGTYNPGTPGSVTPDTENCWCCCFPCPKKCCGCPDCPEACTCPSLKCCSCEDLPSCDCETPGSCGCPCQSECCNAWPCACCCGVKVEKGESTPGTAPTFTPDKLPTPTFEKEVLGNKESCAGYGEWKSHLERIIEWYEQDKQFRPLPGDIKAQIAKGAPGIVDQLECVSEYKARQTKMHYLTLKLTDSLTLSEAVAQALSGSRNGSIDATECTVVIHPEENVLNVMKFVSEVSTTLDDYNRQKHAFCPWFAGNLAPRAAAGDSC